MCKEGKKMKGFGKVFRFELKNYLQNRLFVGITFFLVIAIAVVLPPVHGALRRRGKGER